MSRPLSVGFAGTPEIAATVLKDLLNKKDVSVSLIITQPDRPAGRGKKTKASEVKELTLENNLPIFQPETKSELEGIAVDKLDLLIVIAFGMVMPLSILETPKHGSWNIHTSLLPRWRGAAPIQRAIEAGDTQTGITIMQMNAGLDTGDILLQQSCEIEPTETAQSLHDKLAQLSSEALSKTLTLLHEQNLSAIPQDNTQACYARKITKQEAEINWEENSKIIEQKIRAFNPFPICFTTLNNINMRVWQATISSEESSLAPGEVVSASEKGIEVATKDKNLLITKLQLPGKKRINAKDFLNGHPDFAHSLNTTTN